MLKHLSTRQPTDHLRTPSNGLSESGQSDRIEPPPRRLLTNNNVMAPHPSHQHHLANGYTSPGRYSTAGSSSTKQQPQMHNISMHNTSKHSLSPTTSNISPGTGANHTKTTLTSNLDHSRDESLPFNFSNGPLSSSIFITDRSLPIGDHTFLSNG